MNEKTRQQAIEILANNSSPECEALIKQFVWANTATPKYKIGDPVKFVPQGVSINRNVPRPGGGWDRQQRRAGEVVGRVTEVQRLIRYQTFQYTVVYETDLEDGEINGARVTDHKACPMESSLKPASVYVPTKWSDLGKT